MSKEHRVNRDIRAKEVRVIDAAGEQKGVLSLEEALRLAEEQGFDLVEVAPNIVPPVCKLIDYGKFQYRQRKIEQKHRQKQPHHEIKGIRLSIRTGSHDLQVKINQAEKFLRQGHTIKVSLIFRGREMAHRSLALEKMTQFSEALKTIARLEAEPKAQGYSMNMILHPLS